MNIHSQPTEPRTGKTSLPGQKRQAITRPLPEYVNTQPQTPGPNNPISPILPIRRRSNSGRKWFWLFISVLILLTLLLAFVHLFQHQEDSTASPRTFQVGPHPLLIIKAHVGNVSLHAADTDTITVRLHQHNSFALPTDTRLQATQDPDRLTLTPDPYFNGLDYDITAPASTHLQVQVNDGSLAISGIASADLTTINGSVDISDISGPLQAQTTNGDITVNSVHGSTNLTDQNGSLHLSDITGSLHAVTSSGDVIVSSSHLGGQSVLTTENGSVRLNATLNPTGSYRLETTSGDIDLTLPSTSAFQLDAHTNSGSVRNAFNNDQVGATPRAQITASVMNGSVIVDIG